MPSFLSKFVLPFSVVVALFAVVAFPTIKNDTRVQTYVSENFGFDITGNPITFAIDTLKSGFTPPPPSVHTNNRGDSSDSDSSDYTSNPSSFFSAEMMSPAAAASARTFNAAFNPSYGPPVALFVGGTSGIGQGTAEAFARHTKGNAHIFIIGRNRAAAESIIASFPKPTAPGVTHEFVQCDLTLMKNVHKVTQELLIRHPKINFLVMSPGFMTMNGRNETEEGIDTKLAVHYYSRWKLIDDLLPALRSARDAGEDAKVLSVLAAGKGGAIDVEDLGLKKAFTVVKAGLQAPTYNDLMMEVCCSLSLFAVCLLLMSCISPSSHSLPSTLVSRSHTRTPVSCARTLWPHQTP